MTFVVGILAEVRAEMELSPSMRYRRSTSDEEEREPLSPKVLTPGELDMSSGGFCAVSLNIGRLRKAFNIKAERYIRALSQ